MPRSHECLGGCGRRVGRAHACPACWARLRPDLRAAITSARRKTRAYSVALHNAAQWFADNPAEDASPQDHQHRAAS